jgi:HSP20 family protein
MMKFIQKITGDSEDFEVNENEALEENFDVEFGDGVMELPTDVYEVQNNIFVRSFIPGVAPEKIEVKITRSLVEISGERIDTENIESDDFRQQELIWGNFERKISLPNEIDVDKVKANFKNGMVVLKMPKLDKDRSVKVLLNS